MSAKIGIASSLGAFIGALAALQLGYFWWLGSLLGAIIGFIVYDIKAIPVAMRQSIHWHPSKNARTNMKALLLAISPGIAIGMLLAAFVIGLGVLSNVENKETVTLVRVTTFARLSCLLSPIGIFVSFVWMLDELSYKGNNAVKAAILFSPIALPFTFAFYAIKYAFAGMRFAVLRAPRATVTVAKRTLHVLVVINNDTRLLCAVSAGLGACIGYFAGNAIIGAITGGIIGTVTHASVRSKKLSQTV